MNKIYKITTVGFVSHILIALIEYGVIVFLLVGPIHLVVFRNADPYALIAPLIALSVLILKLYAGRKVYLAKRVVINDDELIVHSFFNTVSICRSEIRNIKRGRLGGSPILSTSFVYNCRVL